MEVTQKNTPDISNQHTSSVPDNREATLILIKPDGVQRGLVGEIIQRIERKALTITALELLTPSREQVEQHYAEHLGRPYYTQLVDFILSSPIIAGVLVGDRAISAFRQIAGGTDPVEKALPGTIRGDFALNTQLNLVHGSDSPEAAAREISLWFPQYRLQ